MWDEEEVPVPRQILEEKIENIHGIFCLLTDTIDQALLERGKHLKAISNMAVGYNNIDISYARKLGIPVTNTPDVLTETTADLTFALLMVTARRITESERYLREGKWQTWSPMLLTGQDIYGATLGIIGMGRIGEALAKRANGFSMNVLYHNRNRKYNVEKKLGVSYAELHKLLEQSDFVCVMTPYTKETHHLIADKELKQMKRTAVLINTSRGGVVDEQALYDALVNGEIWGAGLDVFEQEPLPHDHPLLQLDQVVATPHIGSASIATRLKMAQLAATNLIQMLNGQKNQYIINQVK